MWKKRHSRACTQAWHGGTVGGHIVPRGNESGPASGGILGQHERGAIAAEFGEASQEGSKTTIQEAWGVWEGNTEAVWGQDGDSADWDKVGGRQ